MIPSAMSTEQLAEQIISILMSNGDSMDSSLFDLLGFDAFDFVSELVQNRQQVLAGTKSQAKTGLSSIPVSVGRAGPGQSVTLTTEDAKKEQKAYHKMVARGIMPILDNGMPNMESVEAMQESLERVLKTNETPLSLPHVYASTGRRFNALPGAKMALPTGTIHNDFVNYEEFIIPYPKDESRIAESIKNVLVKDMDELLATGFKGYQQLNKMQSAVFPVAHFSNENMLVCAPTGAGKTDVAMLTILKVIRDHLSSPSLSNGTMTMIKRDEFKIVYVAPMKALAAEITEKFSRRLSPFGIKVREYTGDMQLTRQEIIQTQMIVTTPEKWDVITRKGQGDVDLVQKVKLLIVDEVHLLQDDRGPVIETIIARTLREMEISQRIIRIVGLSATLPNYIDVANFLRVDPFNGLFVFGDAFRPVPLTQQFIGIKGRNNATFQENLNRVAFDKCADFIRDGHQVMIFVHSRMETIKTAKTMIKQAAEQNMSGLFCAPPDVFEAGRRVMEKSRNRELQTVFNHGFAFHHAGMLRNDRSMVERLFAQGAIRVLVCTSTLAWGVNLPAHAVLIKGTQVYDQDKGEFTHLGVLDVLQIFGRAGRPQYETHGEGLILTAHDQMARYINSIMAQVPIESQFLQHIADNLNAEIALGTVSTLPEATQWLKYTYLYVRMTRNPTAYGITPKELALDPDLVGKLQSIAKSTLIKLSNSGMVTLDANLDDGGMVRIRDVGRIASAYYLSQTTVETFGQLLKPTINEEDILAIVSAAAEFSNLRVREEEIRELDQLIEGCPLRIKHDQTTSMGKASLLIVAYISHLELDTFSLVSDSNYVNQSAGRILRALFEIIRAQGWLQAALRCLSFCKTYERRFWSFQHPLGQFGKLDVETTRKLNTKNPSLEMMEDMSKKELGSLLDSPRCGDLIKSLVAAFPKLTIVPSVFPINGTVLRLDLEITPDYDFYEQYHGGSDLWWIFVENPLSTSITHCEEFVVTRKQARLPRKVSFFIPITEPLPQQFYLRLVSDRWVHAESVLPLSFRHLLLPKELQLRYTNLLPLRPLPISALHDPSLEALYAPRFLFFNSIQSQVFHTLYHDRGNVMIGAPTGSGKTIMAEIAMWASLRDHPTKKVLYVAPLKALIKERLADWRASLQQGPLGLRIEELSGDVAVDGRAISQAHLLLATPEKWDSISRGWHFRRFVSDISLMILDEIHLLGSERGHVLEMMVSRMRRVAPQLRIVGLSTALSNSSDIAHWLSIEEEHCYNFRPSVRPVPLEVRIEGFAGRHYCPRMATMNKPAYMAIKSLSPDRPVLIFVSSRRQTRLTAEALIAFCVNDQAPRRFVRMDESELNLLTEQVHDGPLRLCLGFGIALHHAGLMESDRLLGEQLFASGKIQIMVATSTLAWGVNFPAHLVIVKGTEYYDARSHSYVDYPLTDVMQMIGRAGRPQFDQTAKAVLLVHESKRDFYRKFLYESFPLESSLHLRSVLADHLNAEIASGSVKRLEDASTLLKSTFMASRISRNPNYYGLPGATEVHQEDFFLTLIDKSLTILQKAGCIERQVNSGEVHSTDIGKIASFLYLSHSTMSMFGELVGPDESFNSLLRILSLASEFDEAPVRHNEDVELYDFCHDESPALKRALERVVGPTIFSAATDWNDPHTKVLVLLIAHLSHVTLPITDFVTDTKSIMEQAGRIVQGIIEFSRIKGFLSSMIRGVWLHQALTQSLFPGIDSCAAQISGIPYNAPFTLNQLMHASSLKSILSKYRIHDDGSISDRLKLFPIVKMKAKWAGNERVEIAIQCSLNETQLLESIGNLPGKRNIPSCRIIIGHPASNTILGHLKISNLGNIRKPIDLTLSQQPEEASIDEYRCYLLWECFLGLDQEVSVTKK